MSGLIDSQGLDFGAGLQWQKPIGADGLTIIATSDTKSYIEEFGDNPYVAEDGVTFYVTEA